MSSPINPSSESLNTMSRIIENRLKDIPIMFGEHWGGGGFMEDFDGLLLSAKFHKDLAAYILEWVKKHNLSVKITQEEIDKHIDECINITLEDMKNNS